MSSPRAVASRIEPLTFPKPSQLPACWLENIPLVQALKGVPQVRRSLPASLFEYRPRPGQNEKASLDKAENDGNSVAHECVLQAGDSCLFRRALDMANSPQHPDKCRAAGKSDRSQTKRPVQEQGKAAVIPQCAPADRHCDTDQDEGMRRPTNTREVAQR